MTQSNSAYQWKFSTCDFISGPELKLLPENLFFPSPPLPSPPIPNLTSSPTSHSPFILTGEYKIFSMRLTRSHLKKNFFFYSPRPTLTLNDNDRDKVICHVNCWERSGIFTTTKKFSQPVCYIKSRWNIPSRTLSESRGLNPSD